MADAVRNDTEPSKANLALGLGLGALVANVLGGFISGDDDDSNGWIWIVMGLLALGAVVVGLMDGRGKPRGRALVGTVLGGLILLEFVLFLIVSSLSRGCSTGTTGRFRSSRRHLRPVHFTGDRNRIHLACGTGISRPLGGRCRAA